MVVNSRWVAFPLPGYYTVNGAVYIANKEEQSMFPMAWEEGFLSG
jgi:hypothetical protein